MITEFDGADYLLVLEEGELRGLVESPLKTTLTTTEGKTENRLCSRMGRQRKLVVLN